MICLSQQPHVVVEVDMTQQATLSDRCLGIKFSDFARTFQDAVVVIRWLDIRYLWIDALCIIQDSKADWDRESAQMASI